MTFVKRLSLAKQAMIKKGLIAIPTFGFISEWQTQTNGQTITIPLNSGNSSVFDCDIKWGDGTTSHVTSATDANRIHAFSLAGTYQIEIIGTCEGWSFNNTGDKTLINKVIHWGDAGKFTGFKYLTAGFYGCSNFTSIPDESIPISGTGCTSFQNIFNATKLSLIFAKTFKLHVNATTFLSALQNTYLVTVPTDLFRYNLSATIFQNVLSSNNYLETVPWGFFKYNLAVTTFQQAFYYCPKLQINKWIFYLNGEEETRFLNKSFNLTACFQRTSFSGLQGEVPELWKCNFGTGTPNTTQMYSGAGNSITSISNYNDIPEKITLNPAPSTNWVANDIVTGQTSGVTSTIAMKVSSTVYWIQNRSGSYTLGEIIGVTGVPEKLSDQGSSNPVVAAAFK